MIGNPFQQPSVEQNWWKQATPLPVATELGDSSVQGTMAGSFLAPDLHMRWEAPAVAASGTADFSRDANRFTCRAPSLDVSGALFLRPPPFDAVKAVLTQACLPRHIFNHLSKVLHVVMVCRHRGRLPPFDTAKASSQRPAVHYLHARHEVTAWGGGVQA